MNNSQNSQNESMKAAIYQGVGQIGIIDKPIPQLGDNDVLVQIKRAGICATDVTAYQYSGDLVNIYPGDEFGHEMVGVVTSVGAKVEEFAPGARVFINPMSFAALGPERGGAFTEYVRVENAKLNHNLFLIPENVSFDEAVITEPFSVGIHGKNVPQVTKDSKVVIFGAGTIGLSALSGLIGMGLDRVIVADIDEARLKVVEEMGGTPLNSAKADLANSLLEFYGSSYNALGVQVPDVDVYIDCAGAPGLAEQFLSLAKFGAKFVVVAVYKKKVEISLGNLMWAESSMMGSFMYTPQDIQEALHYLSQKNTPILRTITHQFPHNQIREAFEMAIQPAQAIKVVINYDL